MLIEGGMGGLAALNVPLDQPLLGPDLTVHLVADLIVGYSFECMNAVDGTRILLVAIVHVWPDPCV